MKAMRAYLAGTYCGYQLKAEWADGIPMKRGEAAELGCYYEYQTFGSLTREKTVPKPKLLKSAKNKLRITVDDMYAPYRTAYMNASLTREYLSRMGLEIVAKGVRKSRGDYEGTADAILRARKRLEFADGFVLKRGDEVVADAKYSGLIGNVWDEWGWALPVWTEAQEKYHGTQAKQYHHLWKIPFLWIVCSSSKVGEIYFFRATIQEGSMDQHLAEGKALRDAFEMHLKIGFKPKPEFNRCKECPLKENCDSRHNFPHPTEIKL